MSSDLASAADAIFAASGGSGVGGARGVGVTGVSGVGGVGAGASPLAGAVAEGVVSGGAGSGSDHVGGGGVTGGAGVGPSGLERTRRSSLLVPAPSQRAPSSVVMHGYMRRKRRGLFRWGWKKHYFALYRDVALYQFKDADACQAFFDGGGAADGDNQPEAMVSLGTIVGVRSSAEGSVPGGLGVDLVDVHGTESFEVVGGGDGGAEAAGEHGLWLRALADAVGRGNTRLHGVTQDPELRVEVSAVDPSRFADATKHVLDSLHVATGGGVGGGTGGVVTGGPSGDAGGPDGGGVGKAWGGDGASVAAHHERLARMLGNDTWGQLQAVSPGLLSDPSSVHFLSLIHI